MDVELKTSADRFWKGIGEINYLFPKLFPDIYKSIEVLEGDGTSVGTLRRVTFGAGTSSFFFFVLINLGL